jgi:hypothetical protein
MWRVKLPGIIVAIMTATVTDDRPRQGVHMRSGWSRASRFAQNTKGGSNMKRNIGLIGVTALALMYGALGGATGAVIGQQVGGREGAILGGAVGAAAGTAIAVDKDRDGHHHHSVGGSAPAVIVAPPARGGFCPPGQAKKGNC